MIKKIFCLLCFFSLIGFSYLPAQSLQDNDAIIPVAREGSGYERFLHLNEVVQENQGEIDILFIGDSITQGWESAGSEVWNEFYGARRAVNIGISADRTQHVLWRFENGNIDGIYPELTILMIGTNNSGADRNTPPEILAGVKAVVEKIRSSLPDTKILLLGIFPRGAEFNDQRGVITQVNQALNKLDGRENIFFLDIGHAFLESDGSISEEIMPDALHLSPAGYRIWAESIEPFISRHLDE
jgi:lysophospholipase L1-like esterase